VIVHVHIPFSNDYPPGISRHEQIISINNKELFRYEEISVDIDLSTLHQLGIFSDVEINDLMKHFLPRKFFHTSPCSKLLQKRKAFPEVIH
jgi:hypothetical protein